MTFANFSWLAKLWSGYELRFISINERKDLPFKDKSVVIVGTYAGNKTLHFRVFDSVELRVADEAETDLQDKAEAIQKLKDDVAKFQSNPKPTDRDEIEIIEHVASILGPVQWANELYCRTRMLVQLYTEASLSAWRMPHPCKTIHPGGLWGRRKLLVVGWLVRDAVMRHIQINLQHAHYVRQLTEIVNRPTCDEESLGVKKTAPEEVIRKAQEVQRKKRQIRRKALAHMKDAVADLSSLEQEIGSYRSLSSRIVSVFIGFAKHIAPLTFLGFVATQFGKVANMSLWQGVLLCALWIVVYNILGLIGVPFHDAGYRKHLLFEGYIGTPDDGIKPLLPPVSRAEKQFYAHLGIERPIVVSWDDLIPPVHYVVTILMIICSLIFLPLQNGARGVGIVVGGGLIWLYVRQLWWWRRLMAQRYEQSIPWLVVNALLIAVVSQGDSKESDDSEEEGDDNNEAGLPKTSIPTTDAWQI